MAHGSSKGRVGPAVTALFTGISLFSLVLFILSSLATPLRAGEAEPFSKKFESLNFKITLKNTNWVGLKQSQKAKVSLFNSGSGAVYMVFAEDLGHIDDFNNDLLLFYVRIFLNNETLNISESRDLTLNGISGREFNIESGKTGKSFYSRGWAAYYNGIFYFQILSLPRTVTVSEHISELTDNTFPAFRILNTSRLSKKGLQENYTSRLFQYQIRTRNSGWSKWQNVNKSVEGADTGLLRGNTAGFVAVPLFMGNLRPGRRVLAQALLAELNIEYRPKKLRNLKRIQLNKYSGFEFKQSRKMGKREFEYKIQILQGKRYAYMFAVWVDKKHSDAYQKHTLNLLNRIEIRTEGEFVPGPEVMGRQALLYNRIGMFYLQMENYSKALSFVQKAFKYEQGEFNYFLNNLFIMVRLDRITQAEKFLNKYGTPFMGAPDVISFRAFIAARNGRVGAALKDYELIFDDMSYRSEEDFEYYIELLWKIGKKEQALKRTRGYLAIGESVRIRILEASLLARAGRFMSAEKILTALAEKEPFNQKISESLIEVYFYSGRYQKSLALTLDLIENDHNSDYIYFLKGRAQFHLRKYPEALKSFETALKKNPDNQVVQKYAEQTRGILGRGKNPLSLGPI